MRRRFVDTEELVLTPQIGIEFEPTAKHVDLYTRALAACQTGQVLEGMGLDIIPNDMDKEIASILVGAYAEDPEHVSKQCTTDRAASLRPASMVLVGTILEEFGKQQVSNASTIRHLITNKLLLESANTDPKIRLRALEMLGKISDVGLFAEKSELKVTVDTSDDVKALLRAKLEKLQGPVIEAEFEEL